MGETSILNDASGALPQAASETVTIDKWVYGGDGLGRIDGRVILVPFILPGETARVAVGKDIHANLLEVVSPAPERVVPPCPLFTKCGGCHYQHAPYEFQLPRKVEILREQLRRVGKIEYNGEIEIISGPPLAYRNRVQFHVAEGKIGYLEAGSHTLVPVTGDCPIASPKVNQALGIMRERMRDRRFPDFIRTLEIFTNEAEVQINVPETNRPVARSFFAWCESVAALDYATSFGTFRVGPRSFFQVNRFLMERLVDAALEGAEGETALDLYAGVGLFALPLARRFREVHAVEAGSSAVRDLEFNAERAGAAAIRAHRTRVEDFLAQHHSAPEFVLADPPRAGLGKAVVHNLERLAPQRITIVSCDPATLARDLAGLTRYKIRRLILIDLFPQTFHLETIVQLERS